MTKTIASAKPRTITWRYPIAVSAFFGLLHGFGFAAVLNEIGLPQSELLTGLLCFDVGVELGQIIFAAVVLVFIALLQQAMKSIQRADRIKFRVQHSLGYVAGGLAAFWLIDRMMGFV